MCTAYVYYTHVRNRERFSLKDITQARNYFP